MKEKVYKSKADLWVVLVLCISCAGILLGIGPLLLNTDDQLPVLVVIVFTLIFAGTIGLILSMLLYTRYIIRENQLIIRCGPFMQRIDIDRIRTVKRKAWTLLSSPRLSFDTMGIQYNKYDDAFISPRRKEDLIQALKAINPSIEVQ